jgi:hypothetical protein
MSCHVIQLPNLLNNPGPCQFSHRFIISIVVWVVWSLQDFSVSGDCGHVSKMNLIPFGQLWQCCLLCWTLVNHILVNIRPKVKKTLTSRDRSWSQSRFCGNLFEDLFCFVFEFMCFVCFVVRRYESYLQWCQCIWTFHSWLHPRFPQTFICTMFCFSFGSPHSSKI